MSSGATAFTLVEILVVMVIMVILISAVLVATSTVFGKAKIRNTQAVLTIVQEAVDQFEREQKENRTIAKARQRTGAPPPGDYVYYSKRYGHFPPDELELFTQSGLPGSVAGPTLGINGATIGSSDGTVANAAGWPDMQFYAYTEGEWKQNALESRDLAAMIVAIELFSDTASAMLDRIPNDNRHAGMMDEQGEPVLFLDRNGDGQWDPGDLQIRYIIDSWGMALGYHAQRDWLPAPDTPAPSSNHGFWNQASTEMIRLNGGKPIIMSYGPNGGKQFEQEVMDPSGGEKGVASLVGDWMDQSDTVHRINHFLNADNLYANPELKEKLAEGIAPR